MSSFISDLKAKILFCKLSTLCYMHYSKPVKFRYVFIIYKTNTFM